MHYDPPQQTQYRRIMNAPFQDASVLRLEPAFRTNTIALLEPLLAAGGGDMLGAFTSPLPTRKLATLSGVC
jgi:cytochrome P450